MRQNKKKKTVTESVAEVELGAYLREKYGRLTREHEVQSRAAPLPKLNDFEDGSFDTPSFLESYKNTGKKKIRSSSLRAL